MQWYVIVAIAAAAGGLFWFGGRRFCRHAAQRDWIYHQQHNPRPKGITSLGMLEEVYQPSIRHVVDEISEEKARGDQAESGDPPFGPEG